MSKQEEEAGSLRDKLDELRHAAEKLEKTEAALDKWKQMAEGATELKKQVKVS